MSDVRPVAFSDRSPLWGSRWDLPVLASGVSMHAQVLRLRRVFRRLAILRCLPCCLPHSRTRSARGTMQISELNGWPACSPCPCHTQDVTVLSVGFGAEWLARPFSYDSFIRDSRPVYPGAFDGPFVGAIAAMPLQPNKEDRNRWMPADEARRMAAKYDKDRHDRCKNN